MRVMIFAKTNTQILAQPNDFKIHGSLTVSQTKIHFSEHPTIIDFDSSLSVNANCGYFVNTSLADKSETDASTPAVFAIAEPLTTIVGIEKLVRTIIKEFPGHAFRIEDYDEEAASLGFIEFNQSHQLIFNSDCQSMLTAFARVLKYYYPRHPQPNVDAKNGDHHSPYFWQEIASSILAIGASAKQYVGTYRFFNDTAHTPSSIANILGVVTAIPAIAFYYRSNIAIAKKWPALFKQFFNFADWLAKNNEVELEDQRNGLILFFSRLWGDHIKNGAFWEKLTDFILGTGYGGANLGMVWKAFPEQLDHPGLMEIILFCTYMTNWLVGIDKSHKVTLEAIEGAKNFMRPDDESTKVKIKLLGRALKQFENMLKKVHELDSSYDKAATRSSLKGDFANCRTIEDYWRQVRMHLAKLQTAIDDKRKTVLRSSELLSEDSELLESDALPLDAENKYFQFASPFHETKYKTNAVFKSFGYSVAGAAIVSNVGGVSALLAFMGWSTGPIQLIVSILLSQGAFGMNLMETDKGKDAVLKKLTQNIQTAINEKAKTWADSGLSIASLAGIIMSALAATQGIYYTNIGFASMLVQVDSAIADVLQYFCVGSTGLMMTTTKAGPTADLLRKSAKKIAEKCCCGCCCLCRGQLPTVANEEITQFREEQIELLADGLRDMVVAYNRLIKDSRYSFNGPGIFKRINKINYELQFKQRVGISAINVAIYSQQLNKELARCQTREDIINVLEHELEKLSLDFVKAFNAKTMFDNMLNESLAKEKKEEIKHFPLRQITTIS